MGKFWRMAILKGLWDKETPLFDKNVRKVVPIAVMIYLI